MFHSSAAQRRQEGDAPVFRSEASFDRLMEVFEHNYILLRRLMGDLRKIPPELRLVATDRPDILLSRCDDSPYTVTLHMRPQLPSVAPEELPEDIPIRVYLDARTAEVWTRSKSECIREQARGCLQKQWRRNRFLMRWLQYLLQNHYRPSEPTSG
ncbi:MAG: DUF1249 domain-containing protein [Halothiobacillaceae bacterium]